MTSSPHVRVVDLTRPAGHRIVRMLLVTLLVGFFIVRYAIRQYFRKELTWRADNGPQNIRKRET